MDIKYILSNSFGGIDRDFYIKQFLFCLIIFVIPSIILFVIPLTDKRLDLAIAVTFCMFIYNFLYPYAKYALDTMINNVMDGSVYLVPVIYIFFIKLFLLAMCIQFTPILAIIGLVFLYRYNTRSFYY